MMTCLIGLSVSIDAAALVSFDLWSSSPKALTTYPDAHSAMSEAQHAALNRHLLRVPLADCMVRLPFEK